jgi:hypothetical protein
MCSENIFYLHFSQSDGGGGGEREREITVFKFDVKTSWHGTGSSNSPGIR